MMKKLLLNSTLTIILAVSVFWLLAIIPDFYKRMFGQILSIASMMVVSVICYAHFSCVRRRVMCSVIEALKGDKRRLRVFFRNKRAMSLALTGISSTLIAIGQIAQISGDQVADKPIFFHMAIPLMTVVLIWVATNKLTPNGSNK